MSEDNENAALVKSVTETIAEPAVMQTETVQTVEDLPSVEEAPVDTKIKEVIEAEIPKVVVKQQYVTQEFTISREGDETNPGGIVVDLPSAVQEDVYKFLVESPNIGVLSSKLGAKWFGVVENARAYNTQQQAFIPTMEDEEADFRQRVEYNGKSMSAGTPKLNITENQVLTGERAVMHLNMFLGRGTVFQVPLWHSGFWITFKAPQEAEYVELQRILVSDKIKFGRDSYGLVYSNMTTYSIDRLVDFALEHVYTTTVNVGENSNIAFLKTIINSQDIFTLLWGFICTMYPRGFQYNRACLNDIEKCNHVLEEVINVTKLQWTNTNALTQSQKNHMSNRRANSVDLASVKRYKEETLKTQNRTVVINKDTDKEIKLTLRSPSIAEYVESGYQWINGITSIAERSISDDVPIANREDYILKSAQATAMRQYDHWVAACEFSTNSEDEDKQNSIEDKDSIRLVLDSLSAQDNIRNDFFTEVTKYINESTISVIGIPTYDCPKCGKVQEETESIYPKHTNIIPLDVVQLFFVLLEQSIRRLTIR